MLRFVFGVLLRHSNLNSTLISRQWKTATDGTLYLTPTKTAQPSIYAPLDEHEQIVLDVINISRMGMGKTAAEIQKTIQQFAVKYDLFFPFDKLDVIKRDVESM